MSESYLAMSKDLKPCPFCGSKAIMQEHDSQCFVIMCTECDCMMPQGCYADKYIKEAIEEWNTRV